jgi:hypothetical protein
MNIKYIYGYLAEIVEDNYRFIRRKIISKYQKLRYGSSDEECWNVFRVIARHNLKKLRYFRNMQLMGHPAEMTENDWLNQIDEIIWAYDYILDTDKYNPIPDCGEFKVVEQEEGIKRTIFDKDEACSKRWNEYNEKAKELEARKKKALVWFAENFETFWD